MHLSRESGWTGYRGDRSRKLRSNVDGKSCQCLTKIKPGGCSIDSGRDMLVEHLAKTGEWNGPWITSSCHPSSTVSKRSARIFRISWLSRMDMYRLKASGGEALQFPENVCEAIVRIGKRTGGSSLNASCDHLFWNHPVHRDRTAIYASTRSLQEDHTH